MNIILNIPEDTPGIDIGENLRMFRSHSIEMTPPNRGLDLAGFEFVRSAHNRFGKRLETCHEDISMEQKYEQSQKKSKKKSTKGGDCAGAEASDVYHFIAYVPYEGNVYELDGLKRSPSVVGNITLKTSHRASLTISRRRERERIMGGCCYTTLTRTISGSCRRWH